MPIEQGDLALLQHPVAQELLQSKIPARLAYIGTDGSPRVVPIWFHWNQRAFAMASMPASFKLKALAANPKVALTIDDNTFPHKVLLVRGTARLDTVEGVVPEYAAAAERYLGTAQASAWIQHMSSRTPNMVRITVTPHWVGVLDFKTRVPAALSR